MSKAKYPERFLVSADEPEYGPMMGEKLAELALLRTALLDLTLIPLKLPPGQPRTLFDLVAASETGVCFLVQIKTYSSFQLKIQPDSIPVLELELDADRIRAARQSPTTIVTFLFDADRGHGRYLRLDTLPQPNPKAKTVVLSFPVANTITAESIRALALSLEKDRAVPVAS